MSKMAQNIVFHKVNDLIPYARNARTHSADQILKLRSSIREFGFTNPVLIDSDNGIIAGHGRVMAAKEEGITEVPSIVIDYMTEAQKKAYILADNRLAMDAGWDEELLKLELGELRDEFGYSLDLTGFSEKELDVYLSLGDEGTLEDDFDTEEALEAIVVPVSRRGDIWCLGRHRLMCGDSVLAHDIEKLMDGKTANMLFTDPPYGYEYQSNMRTKTEKFDVLINDDKILNFMPLLKGIVDGFVFICTSWKVLDKWIPLFKSHFEFSNMIIWDKGGGGIGDLKKTFSTDYEVILVSHQGKELTGKRIGSVWKIAKDGSTSYEHATQKPVDLPGKAIIETTQSNCIVLDLFGGYGSTLIACEQTNRIGYTMELDEKYCDVIVRRYIELVGSQDDVKLFRDGVETEFSLDYKAEPME